MRSKVIISPSYRAVRGMTLIELMTVVLVVAILASISVGSYRGYLLRTNRTDGRQALLRIQVAEEKFFLQNNAYTTNFTAAPPTGLGVSGATTPGGYYTLAVVVPDPNNAANPASYQATATATGGQTSDVAACQTLTINDQGVRTPADSSGCWK